MLGRPQNCSQRPDCPACAPGGSETHIEPDSSTMKRTLTGKFRGSGGAGQSLGWSVRLSSLAVDGFATASTYWLLQVASARRLKAAREALRKWAFLRKPQKE